MVGKSRNFSVLNSRSSIIKKAIYYGKINKETDAQIKENLAKQGINVSIKALRTERYSMRKKGILTETVANQLKNIIIENPKLSNSQIIKLLEKAGVKTTRSEIQRIRKTLGIKCPSKIKRILAFNLNSEKLAILERVIPSVKVLVRSVSRKFGIKDYDTQEDFLGFCLAELPCWVSKAPDEKTLRIFLRSKVETAMKQFLIEKKMQETGMTRKEVRLGIRLLKRLRRGETIEEACKIEKTTPKEAIEIIKALNYRTIYYDDILGSNQRGIK